MQSEQGTDFKQIRTYSSADVSEFSPRLTESSMPLLLTKMASVPWDDGLQQHLELESAVQCSPLHSGAGRT